jgi:NADPH2:quinone reductase
MYNFPIIFKNVNVLNVPREYGPNEVLVRVVVAASNPKDWKHPMPNYFNVKVNQGDDCSGYVEAVGNKVKNFKKGDKVAGFHEMDTPRGTYAEFAVVYVTLLHHLSCLIKVH